MEKRNITIKYADKETETWRENPEQFVETILDNPPLTVLISYALNCKKADLMILGGLAMRFTEK